MRSFFKKSPTKSKIKRTRKSGINYGTLEERRVLATTAAFVPSTGILTVSLTDASDTAIVVVVNNNVTLNGSDQVLGGNTAGTLSANDVR